MTQNIERRRDGRAAPSASWRIRIGQSTSEVADWFARDVYTKALLGALLVSAIVVLCWSLVVQLRTANDFNAAIQREIGLRLQRDDQRAMIKHLVGQDFATKIARAEQRLVPDYGNLAGWLHDLQAACAAQGILLTYTVNEEQRFDNRPGLLAVPLMVSLQRLPSSIASPYISGVSLLRQLTDGPWAGELVAASGEGEGRGLQRLRFEYRIWMRTRDGFDRSPDRGAEVDATLATQTPEDGQP